MTKPMLISALKPGMRAVINPHGTEDMIVENRNNAIMVCDDNHENRYVSNISYLTTTDYEIIEDKPEMWEPKCPDYGWGIDCDFEAFQMEATISQKALPTKKAAEHKAKLDRIITAIMRMPGYGGDGDGPHVFLDGSIGEFQPHKYGPTYLTDFTFDTYENAKAAADRAKELMQNLD